MPSFDNQKNVNTQHRRGKTNISQGYCKNKLKKNMHSNN